MMKSGKFLGTAMIASALLVVLSACPKPEGPMERAGKDVDQAVEKVGEQIEKAGDNIQDAAKDNKK
ncbi:MAG: hypothetical protein H6R07_3204 [Proteobacteria bacterium]|nr:hypothetical protein [Pseudomonadota bacterium]